MPLPEQTLGPLAHPLTYDVTKVTSYVVTSYVRSKFSGR